MKVLYKSGWDYHSFIFWGFVLALGLLFTNSLLDSLLANVVLVLSILILCLKLNRNFLFDEDAITIKDLTGKRTKIPFSRLNSIEIRKKGLKYSYTEFILKFSAEKIVVRHTHSRFDRDLMGLFQYLKKKGIVFSINTDNPAFAEKYKDLIS